MAKAVERDLVRELETGVALLVYDVPWPPKPRSKEERKALAPWFSWYDWATSALRRLGYPIQYSVVLIDESRIKDVEEVVRRIEDKRQSLNRAFKLRIPPPHVNVIRFNPKSREDAQALLDVIRQGLKATLEAFISEIKEQLEEGKDRTKLQQRVKNFIGRLQRQDFLKLMLKDAEIRSLVLQLEVLTA